MARENIRRFVARHSPSFMLAALCVALAAWSPEFRQANNVQQVAVRTCVIAVLAIGQLLAILSAGIDLSVGSVAALSGVVAGLAMTRGEWGVLPGCAAGMTVGVACGALNGFLVTAGRIPPFIVTLGMMMSARGGALLVSGGEPVYGLPTAFKYLGGAQKMGEMNTWWIPVLIVSLLALTFMVVLSLTRYGRALYATGGNLTGARLSGVNVNLVRAAAYTLSGAMAGFAGLMLAAWTSIAAPSAAETYELEAIAACVIGGTSLMGGEGGVAGAIAGALIMKVLENICNLSGIEREWQIVIVGALVVALVFYDNLRKRRAGLLKD